MDIYLIYSHSNDYDICNSVNGYTLTEVEAIKAVDTLKEAYLKAMAFNDTINEAVREFEKENPTPLIRENLITIPKRPSGIGKDAITPKMREERNYIMEKNQKTIEENSKLYAEWQIKQMEFLKPIIEPVKEEAWFKKWFDIGERFVSCKAYRLVEGHEYIYERCEEISGKTL